jgi:hypothetical protein
VLTDSFLSNAGWLFFAAWSAILTALSVTAFGNDLLPSKASVDSPHATHSSTDPAGPSNSQSR